MIVNTIVTMEVSSDTLCVARICSGCLSGDFICQAIS